MRPAYRYSLVVLAALCAAGLVGYGIAGTPLGSPAASPNKADDGIALAPKGGEDLAQMLDRLQAAEAERFGADEAAKRRRSREQLLERRKAHGDKH